MVTFFNNEMVRKSIEKDITEKMVHGTKRNGNSISLRPIVYNCVREVYFEIFDYEKQLPTDLSTQMGFYWTGPIGSAIHEKFQDITGLSGQEYTEKLMTFESFSPLYVRSKCDGIDLRDPDNIVLYEIKTKKKLVDRPYDEELLQNLLSVYFFRKECKVNIKGSSMVYISRENPHQMQFFNYDFFDKLSPVYFDPTKKLTNILDKVNEIRHAMIIHKPPSMKSRFVKRYNFGRSKCAECLYRDACAALAKKGEEDYYCS